MIKRFCDRCGAEIKPNEAQNDDYLSIISHMRKEELDLCLSCKKDLASWFMAIKNTRKKVNALYDY